MASPLCTETYSGVRVDRTAIDIQELLGQHLGALVNGSSRSIKDTAEHVLRDAKLQTLSGELDFCLASMLATVIGVV